MKVQRRMRVALTVLGAAVLAALVAGTAQGTPPGSGWGPPKDLGAPVDTSGFEGCPAESPDGKSLYFVRFNSQGTLDIWVSHRASKTAEWGTPTHLPAPVNTAPVDGMPGTGFEFCPTPVPGNGLFFVSSRPGYCGQSEGKAANSDVYFTRYNPATDTWSEPVHLACASEGGPNSDGWAQGPSYFRAGGHGYLYFSSGPNSLPDGLGYGHIYVSEQQPDGSFGLAQCVTELNSSCTDTTTTDIRPNVSADGREVVFESTRAGGIGGRDIWTATRPSPNAPWSTPVDITAVNTSADTHRATLSRDGKRLYFASVRETDGQGNPSQGSADIFVSTRK